MRFKATLRGFPAMAASSPSSLAPPAVPMELHAGNRDRLVAALRDHLSASGRPYRGLVLLQVGPTRNPSFFSPPPDYYYFFDLMIVHLPLLTFGVVSVVLRAKGGDEQTRYCTDHLELFRCSR